MEGIQFDKCDFGVLKVTIVAADRATVTFSTRSASRTGDPDECLLRVFTVPLSEVYTQPIAGAPEAVALVPGATGNLFLSSAGWQTTSSDGFAIYGRERVVLKWPACGAAPSRVLSELKVYPSRIVMHGHLEGESECFELDLLGPDADGAQELVWNGAALVELRLSQHGAARLHVKSRSTVVRVWPTRIIVHGSPEIDRAVSGEVDVLNTELAGEVQVLAFTRPGALIALSLTQDGVNAFHVTPQAVAEIADDLSARIVKPAPERRLAAD